MDLTPDLDLTPDAVIVRRSDVVYRELAGERLLVPIRREAADLRTIFALTGIGAFVWEQLDGERSLAAVLQAILARYEVPEEQARSDLYAVLGRLAAAGLTERRA